MIGEFATGLAKTLSNVRLEKALQDANKAHANFYHSFIDDREEFKEMYENILYGVQVMYDYLALT